MKLYCPWDWGLILIGWLVGWLAGWYLDFLGLKKKKLSGPIGQWLVCKVSVPFVYIHGARKESYYEISAFGITRIPLNQLVQF